LSQKHTRYFYELTPDRILEAFEAAGIACQPAVRFLNSLENRVAQVEDMEGERWVAKFYRPGRWTREAIADEHGFVRELEAASVPVSAPVPLERYGGTIGETAGIYFAVFRHQVGRPPDELSVAQAHELGDLVARVHEVGSRKPAKHRPGWTVSQPGQRDLEILERERVMPAETWTRYRKVAERILPLVKARLRGLDMIRIHGDFHRGNLLWPSLGPVIVDFDDMAMGPPVQDLWMLLPGRDPESLEQRDLFLNAYEKRRPFERRSLASIEILRALRYIRYAAWLAERRADPAFKRVLYEYGTSSYWRQEIAELEAQLRLVEGTREIR
jgi:Ser/Thr protein kinase RdoA (MazF antagonist)